MRVPPILPILALPALLLACGPSPGDGTAGDVSTSSSASTSTSTGTSDPPTSTSTATSTSTSTATTEDPPTSSTGDPTASTTIVPGSTGTSTANTTGLGDGCESLEESSCEDDPDCMAIVGVQYALARCPSGPVFLACVPATGCDDAPTTICKEGSPPFQLPNGCIPPGFTACSVRDVAPCGSAEACKFEGEEDCAASGCTPIHGAPHVVKDGMACADFGAQVFLGCLEGGIACPPQVLTVCPEGQLDTAFDVPAGCLPPNHMLCDQQAPGCQ